MGMSQTTYELTTRIWKHLCSMTDVILKSGKKEEQKVIDERHTKPYRGCHTMTIRRVRARLLHGGL